MASNWSKKRQSLYLSVAGTLALILIVVVYAEFFTTAPTCFDQKLDGDEHGVDCGGSCALVCAQESQTPKVLWGRAFATSAGSYTAAAYIENDNPGAGAKAVRYSFQLFDKDNTLIVERDGVADLPPVETIPIVEPNIPVKNQVVARTLFSFSQVPVWYRIPGAQVPSLTVAGQGLAADASRLSATVENDSLIDAHGVIVDAVLFDSSGTAVGASKSIVDVARKSSVPVVFTWPSGVPGVVRAEITVLPPF